MKTNKYHQARKELKSLIANSLMQQTAQKANRKDVPESFRNILEAQGDELLNTFEEIVDGRRFRLFWFGVFQSFIGSIVFAIFLVVIAIILYGSRLDLRDLMSGRTNPIDNGKIENNHNDE